MSPGTPAMVKSTFVPISGLAGLKLIVGWTLPLPTNTFCDTEDIAPSSLLLALLWRLRHR